jgi:PAS domain S-box-containing protein
MGLHGFELVNRAYEEFVGAHEPEVQRFDWTRYLHPDDREAYLAAYVDAFSRRAVFEASARLRRADGVYRWMRSVGQPRFLEDGQFVGYVGGSYDITDLKEAQESLRQLNRSKDVFLAMLSHELRNPLPPSSASHLLATGSLSREGRRAGRHQRQTLNMVRLVDDSSTSPASAGKICAKRPYRWDISMQSARPTSSASARRQLRSRYRKRLCKCAATPPASIKSSATFSSTPRSSPRRGTCGSRSNQASDRCRGDRGRDNGEGITRRCRRSDLFVQGRPRLRTILPGWNRADVDKLLVGTGNDRSPQRRARPWQQFVVRLPLGMPTPPSRPGSADSGWLSTQPQAHPGGGRQSRRAESQAALLELAGHAVRNVRRRAFRGCAEFHPDVILLDIGARGGCRSRSAANDPNSKACLSRSPASAATKTSPAAVRRVRRAPDQAGRPAPAAAGHRAPARAPAGRNPPRRKGAVCRVEVQTRRAWPPPVRPGAAAAEHTRHLCNPYADARGARRPQRSNGHALRGHVDCGDSAITRFKSDHSDRAKEIVMNRSFVAVVAAIAFLAGCNTMQGLGKDITAGGNKVEDVLKKDEPEKDANVSTPANPDQSTTGSTTDRSPAASGDTSASTPSGTSTQ